MLNNPQTFQPGVYFIGFPIKRKTEQKIPKINKHTEPFIRKVRVILRFQEKITTYILRKL